MPAFFARQDTKTPMRAAIWTIAVNVLLTIAITMPLWLGEVEGAHGGIGLATGLAGIFNAWLLWRYVRRAGLHQPRPGWGVLALRMLLACAALAATVLVMRGWVGDFRELEAWSRAAWLLLTIGAGVAAYAATLWLSGMRPRDLREH